MTEQTKRALERLPKDQSYIAEAVWADSFEAGCSTSEATAAAEIAACSPALLEMLDELISFGTGGDVPTVAEFRRYKDTHEKAEALLRETTLAMLGK